MAIERAKDGAEEGRKLTRRRFLAAGVSAGTGALALGGLSPGAVAAVSASSFNNAVDKAFSGWLGDVRIADRAPDPKEWLTGRPN